MRKVKIITIILAILLLSLIAFGGIYIQTQNRMENKVRGYQLGRELDSQRVVELKVAEEESDEENTETTDNAETTQNTETTESTEETENTENAENTTEKNEGELKKETINNYEIVKQTIENRLDALNATDYTISLNKNDGTIRVELPENEFTDMYIYYLTAESLIEIKDKESEEVLLDNDMIKKAHYSYNVNNSGSYQIHEEIELTKEGQAKLNEILNNYALLQTEIDGIEEKEDNTESTTENTTSTENTTASVTTENVQNETNTTQTTENTEEDNSEQSKKIANLVIDDTTYEVTKIEDNKITVQIGTDTSNTTYVNSYMSQAAEIAMLQNSGKMPIKYETYSNRYEYSDITKQQIEIFDLIVLGILLIVLIVFCIKYKMSGLLVSISFVGFLAIYSLIIRYTNVMISIEGICAIILIIFINLSFNQKLLEKTKKVNLLNEALKLTYKDIFSKIVPIIILTIVTCLTKWDNLSSFGMVMFWGIVLIAIYNLLVTRTFLKLKKQ